MYILCDILFLTCCLALAVASASPSLRRGWMSTNLIITECLPHGGDEVLSLPADIPNFYYLNGNIAKEKSTTVRLCHRGFSVLDITWDVKNSNLNTPTKTPCEIPLHDLGDFVLVVFPIESQQIGDFLQVINREVDREDETLMGWMK